MQSIRYQKRLKKHPHSEISKARGKLPTVNAPVSIGDIVCLKEDGSKHKARELYLITDVNYEKSEVHIQKFCGNQLQSRKYVVKFTEIYPASVSVPLANSKEEEEISDDDITLYKSHEDTNTSSVPLISESRRSNRIRKSPDWLSTEEIDRI